MLLISKRQMEVFSYQQRQSFIRRLMVHLHRCDQVLNPEITRDYTSPLALQQLDDKVRYLQGQEFSKEKDIVEVIEFIELYKMPLFDAQVKRLIGWKEYGIRERIDLLFYLLKARGLL